MNDSAIWLLATRELVEDLMGSFSKVLLVVTGSNNPLLIVTGWDASILIIFAGGSTSIESILIIFEGKDTGSIEGEVESNDLLGKEAFLDLLGM